MENVFNIISIVLACVGVVNGVIAWFKAIKNGNTAKAEQAKNAIDAEIKRLVADAEVNYAPIDATLKQQGRTAGSMKKSIVTNDLKAFCLENKIKWDAAEMDAAIENAIAFTKSVNGKEN